MEAASRYRIVRSIGRGGMAEVFEGVLVGDTGFQRRVALKCLLHEHANVEWYAKAFIDEARIGSQLHHGNIVAVVDFGTMDDLPFQVLELVDGLELGALRQRVVDSFGSFPIELALEIAVAVADGLDYAHRAVDSEGRAMGIVHRDVAPDNVLISWAGEVKLIDFGIALAHRRLEATQIGVVKGKLDYMAPEQLMAEDLDRRADIFGLGCLLHFMITGDSPVRGRNTELLVGQVTIDPTVPADVRDIIGRATERDRVHRYPTADDLRRAALTVLLTRQAKTSAHRLRELVPTFRAAPPTPTPKGGLAALFNLDFVLEKNAKSELRRFASMVGHSGTVPVTTQADQVAEPGMRTDADLPLGTELIRARETPGGTEVTEAPALDEQEAEPTELVTAPGERPTRTIESRRGASATAPLVESRPGRGASATAAVVDKSELTGRIIGGIRVVARLGKLKTAHLYQGEHNTLHAPRLLVVLEEQASLAGALVRLAQIRDPQVMPILDSGTVDGSDRPFFVSEAPLGVPLVDAIELDRSTPGSRLAIWMRQLALGVAALRASGVPFGAIDPAHVFSTSVFGGDTLRILPLDVLATTPVESDAEALLPIYRRIASRLDLGEASSIARGLDALLDRLERQDPKLKDATSIGQEIDRLLLSSPMYGGMTPTPSNQGTPVITVSGGTKELTAAVILVLGLVALVVVLIITGGPVKAPEPGIDSQSPAQLVPSPEPTVVVVQGPDVTSPSAEVAPPSPDARPEPSSGEPSSSAGRRPRPPPSSSPRETPRPRATKEAATQRVQQALRSRHLALDDLRERPEISAQLGRYERGLSGGDWGELDAAATELAARIQTIGVDSALLRQRAKRVGAKLSELVGKISAEDQTRLEKTYLDLKGEIRSGISASEGATLLERLVALEDQLNKLH